MLSDVCELTIEALSDALASKQISSVEATQACLTRIAHIDSRAQQPGLNAYIEVTSALALEQAQAADRRRATGQSRGLLDGVPIAVKDNMQYLGTHTTCASHMLSHFKSPYSATVVNRLCDDAGAVLLGKLNMDEFAMGSSNEHSVFGPVKNPWCYERVSGGSSGGSAAAVASGTAFATLGSDTGGSIRQPAAFCGVVGLKPTYGRVSRYGVVAYASSLDQVGPLTKNVRDNALVLQAIAGPDAHDATTSPLPVPNYLQMCQQDIKGLKIGIPQEYFVDGIDAEVHAAMNKSIAALENLGAHIVPISLPYTEYGIATYYILASAEASSNLARYDGVRYGQRESSEQSLLDMYCNTRMRGFGTEVKKRIILGTFVLSSGSYDAYYMHAQQVRTLIRQDFDRAFAAVDVIVAPTTPTAAFLLGENNADPWHMYLADIFTISANLADIPALSLPCGFSSNRLPIGMQILGAPFQEGMVLRVARAYEEAHTWHAQRPEMGLNI